MYSSNTLRVKLLINNVLSVIQKDNEPIIYVVIQLNVDFLTNEDRGGFCKSYGRNYEDQNMPHNHRKVLTV